MGLMLGFVQMLIVLPSSPTCIKPNVSCRFLSRCKTKKMKLFKREDFLLLTAGTIYSRVNKEYGELMNGLYCKTSGEDYIVDWVEQDLISEAGFPNDIKDGGDAIDYQLNLRDTFQEFETDLECAGRDGMFEDEDVFVVWNKKDITKLIIYLQGVMSVANGS